MRARADRGSVPWRFEFAMKKIPLPCPRHSLSFSIGRPLAGNANFIAANQSAINIAPLPTRPPRWGRGLGSPWVFCVSEVAPSLPTRQVDISRDQVDISA